MDRIQYRMASLATAHGDWPHVEAEEELEEVGEDEEGEDEEGEEDYEGEEPYDGEYGDSEWDEVDEELFGAGAEEDEYEEPAWIEDLLNATPNSIGMDEVLEAIDEKRTGEAYVVIFAEWCGHCKELMKKLRIKLNGGKQDVHYPNVFLIEEKSATDDLKKQLNVEGYPTVVHFVGGAITDKASSPDDVVKFVSGTDEFKRRPAISDAKPAARSPSAFLSSLAGLL